MDIVKALQVIKDEMTEELFSVDNLRDLEQIKIKYLGRRGVFKQFSDFLKTIQDCERPAFGKSINEAKAFIESSLSNKQEFLARKERTAEFEAERIDVSLSGSTCFLGGGHILKDVLDEIVDSFVCRGFVAKEGPNIESEHNNFSLLNFTEDHPARLMHDTFYVDETFVLRTHTSNVQVREMQGCEFPISIVSPGLCFRNEDISSRSHMVFHQVEVFHVDRGVGFSDLTHLLEDFFRDFFKNSQVKLRFRHSYFPFVEPGIEVDVGCIKCEGNGCSLCKGSGWLEVAGAGLIHPQVLRNTGVDVELYSGYAIGMGVERLVMLRHEIPDIRLFFENDLRFLSQF